MKQQWVAYKHFDSELRSDQCQGSHITVTCMFGFVRGIRLFKEEEEYNTTDMLIALFGTACQHALTMFPVLVQHVSMLAFL